MKKWEYKLIWRENCNDALEDRIKLAGLEGWELVSVSTESIFYKAGLYFKREIRDNSAIKPPM